MGFGRHWRRTRLFLRHAGLRIRRRRLAWCSWRDGIRGCRTGGRCLAGIVAIFVVQRFGLRRIQRTGGRGRVVMTATTTTTATAAAAARCTAITLGCRVSCMLAWYGRNCLDRASGQQGCRLGGVIRCIGGGAFGDPLGAGRPFRTWLLRRALGARRGQLAGRCGFRRPFGSRRLVLRLTGRARGRLVAALAVAARLLLGAGLLALRRRGRIAAWLAGRGSLRTIRAARAAARALLFATAALAGAAA